MMLNKDKAMEILDELAARARTLWGEQHGGFDTPTFTKWKFDVQTAIQSIFPMKQDHLVRFNSISFRAPQ